MVIDWKDWLEKRVGELQKHWREHRIYWKGLPQPPKLKTGTVQEELVKWKEKLKQRKTSNVCSVRPEPNSWKVRWRRRLVTGPARPPRRR